MKKLSFSVIMFLCLGIVSHAGNNLYEPAAATASAMLPATIISEDLTDGKISIHPTVGYFITSVTVDGAGAKATAHGYGETAEVSYSLSSHFGISLAGINFKGTGTYTPGNMEQQASSGTCSLNGWMAMAALLIDPFSGDEFRMPLILGANYEYFSSSTPTAANTTSSTLNSPGYTLGISPRFNLAFLRLEPFFVMSEPLNKASRTCAPGTVAAGCDPNSIDATPIIGMNIVFRPLNLSFFFDLSALLFGGGSSFYSIGTRFTF